MKPEATPFQLRAFRDMPGPAQAPWLGNAFSFARENRLEWLTGLSPQYGQLVRLKFFGKRIVLVQDPEWIRYILQTHYKDFTKQSWALDKVRVVLGNGLFTSEGEFWRKQRKLAQPAFYKQRLEGIGRIMIDCIAAMLGEWEQVSREGRSIDLAQAMMQLTLNVVTRSMFSTSLSEAEFDTFARIFPSLLRETNRRIIYPYGFLHRLPDKDALEYARNVKRLDAIICRIIDERKRSREEYDDLLGMLMSARDEQSGRGMSNEQLRDEVMTLFIAGHETTAQALCWALYQLDRRPEIRDNLEAEAHRVLGDRLPTARDFPALPYALKVIQETLRLYPPVALFVRCNLQPFAMAGYHIPADTRMLLPPYLLHRDPGFWAQPDRFDPERFTPEAEKQRPKFVYFPFGGGPRICIGKNFALMEAVLALAMIARQFRVEAVAPEKVSVDFTLTLRPKGGLPVRIKEQR